MQGLREESRLLSANNQMTLTPQYDQRRGIVTDLLHLLVTSEEPAHYIKSFEHLAAWVDSSLDQYKVLLPGISAGISYSNYACAGSLRMMRCLAMPVCQSVCSCKVVWAACTITSLNQDGSQHAS